MFSTGSNFEVSNYFNYKDVNNDIFQWGKTEGVKCHYNR